MNVMKAHLGVTKPVSTLMAVIIVAVGMDTSLWIIILVMVSILLTTNVPCGVYSYDARAHKKEHVTEWVKNHGKNCQESYK